MQACYADALIDVDNYVLMFMLKHNRCINLSTLFSLLNIEFYLAG